MKERLAKCPLCKSGRFLNNRELTDYAVTKESFIVSKCSNCQLLFTNPRPTAETIDKYYDFPEYYSHQQESKGLTHWLYKKVRKYTLEKKVELIEEYTQEGKLLDYGCGTGEFLKEAKKNLWHVTGIEPNKKARNYANKKLEGKVCESIKNLDKNQSYDIITLYHVLEHIHQLRKTVKDLIKHLKKSGHLIIAVPNFESWDANYYKDHWAGWDVPRHLYHFNKESLANFSKEFNLTLKEVKPMYFDSFYVSLLSEKYKNPQIKLINQYYNAIRVGLTSNQKTKKPGDYSSNIYIFKQKNEI